MEVDHFKSCLDALQDDLHVALVEFSVGNGRPIHYCNALCLMELTPFTLTSMA